MKRIISLFLAVLILTMCLPLTAFSASADDGGGIKRYSVLVLDVSGTAKFSSNGDPIYTADSAIAYVKKSAEFFLTDLLEAEGDNYVAVVTYAETASVLSDFTNDLANVSDKIDALTATDKVRSINAGLLAASELLQNIEEDATKNVILVTTGMTNSGTSDYSGHYNEDTVGSDWYHVGTGINLYAYANSAYATAAELKTQATIYVLGLFQTMEQMPDEGKDVAEFFRLTALDLATSANTFYDVEDPEAIAFTFGEIAGNINATSGLFKYAGKINEDWDSEAKYWYTDSYFTRSATRYNPSLATMSLCMALAAYSSHDKENWYDRNLTPADNDFWQDKLCNIKTLLLGSPDGAEGYKGIGFSDFLANEFWEEAPTKDSIGVCAARKTIPTGSGNYTLIALAVRGGGYGSEWASNFTIGESGEHDGFATARDNVLGFLDKYIKSLNLADDEKNIKIWVTGYSRAGATANMVAGALDSYHTLPDDAVTTIDDIYCYTFEAPQGAVKSNLDGSYSNIFNVLNLNDLVPLVAPRTWDFARYNYQNDKPFPSEYTTSHFAEKYNAMWNEMKALGYGNFDYSIVEMSYLQNVRFDKTKILPFGEPAVWYEDSEEPTHQVEQEFIDLFADKMIPSRAYYYDLLQSSIREAAGILMDYYGPVNGVYVSFMEKLEELFSFGNLYYIVSPMLSINPLKSYEDRVNEVELRLAEKIDEVFYEYTHIDGFVTALSVALTNFVLQVAAEVWNNNTDSINIVSKFAVSMVQSKLQWHYPEICLAWCRSLDQNYSDAAAVSNTSDSAITRVIHINCPVDVQVYDSNEYLVASIVNDKVDTEVQGIVYYVSSRDEKILYLPGDENYDVKITATDSGEVSYSLSEYNYIHAQETRLQNYYDIPVEQGDTMEAIVPPIAESELSENHISGSTALYQLFCNGSELTPAEEIAGAEVQNEYYNVELDTEGTGGFVTGAGRFRKGRFAKAEASALPNAEFLGWYADGALCSEDPVYRFAVTSDTALVAKFSSPDNHKLSFKADGNGTVNGVTGEYPAGVIAVVEAVPDPSYEFAGWTATGGGKFEDASSALTMFTMPNKNSVVTAHFKPAEEIPQEKTITLDPDGGELETDTLKLDDSGHVDSLPIPTKEGYAFEGWYTEAGKIVTAKDTFADGTKLTAHWILIPLGSHTETMYFFNSFTPPAEQPAYQAESIRRVKTDGISAQLIVLRCSVDDDGYLLNKDGERALNGEGNPILWSEATKSQALQNRFSAPAVSLDSSCLHPAPELDTPAEIWKAAEAPESGGTFKVDVYYYPSEQKDQRFLINDGAPVLAGSFEITIETGGNPDNPETGDVDGDHEIGVADAQLVLLAYVSSITSGETNLTEDQFYAADVDGDGKLTVADAQYILNYYVQNVILGIETSWDDFRQKPGKKA